MAAAAIRDQQNRITCVPREKLLNTLRTNRERHQQDYVEALEGYKELATQKLLEAGEQARFKLERNLEKGKATIQEFNPEDPRQSSDRMVLVESIVVEMKVPRDYTREYDAAIVMFEWDTRDTLELTYAEFQCFVCDAWDWSQDFLITNAMYAKKFSG